MGGEELVEDFMKSETYEESPEGPVKLVQTHISWVFLTGKHAYKMKKPVDFGFLDFTTLEKRKFFCEQELELNRRLCPDMYLGVMPVARKDGGLKIGGDGEVIEYVLKMKQLPQENLMDTMLERGEIKEEVLKRIASIVSDFHKKAETSEEIASFSSPEKTAAKWEEHFEQTEEFVGRVIGRETFDHIRERIERFMKEKRELLLGRMRDGSVKRCHGDLHTGNIFVMDGEPCVFDCIEFNKEFSCIDVAAEVAFLSMDLENRGRKDLSDVFLESYVKESGDEGIRELLDFYRCYYAWTRGKVISFRLKEHIEESEEEKIEETAGKYFALARKYAGRI